MISQDLRFAFRTFRRSPGFAAAAFSILALGIGIQTAAFSLLDAVVLRPLPGVRRPGDLVDLRAGGLSYPTYADIRQQAAVFEGVGAWGMRSFDLSTPARRTAPARRRRLRRLLLGPRRAPAKRPPAGSRRRAVRRTDRRSLGPSVAQRVRGRSVGRRVGPEVERSPVHGRRRGRTRIPGRRVRAAGRPLDSHRFFPADRVRGSGAPGLSPAWLGLALGLRPSQARRVHGARPIVARSARPAARRRRSRRRAGRQADPARAALENRFGVLGRGLPRPAPRTPVRRRRPRAAGGVREPGEPAAGTRPLAPPRDRGAPRARSRTPADRKAAAHREPSAGGARRRWRAVRRGMDARARDPRAAARRRESRGLRARARPARVPGRDGRHAVHGGGVRSRSGPAGGAHGSRLRPQATLVLGRGARPSLRRPRRIPGRPVPRAARDGRSLPPQPPARPGDRPGLPGARCRDRLGRGWAARYDAARANRFAADLGARVAALPGVRATAWAGLLPLSGDRNRETFTTDREPKRTQLAEIAAVPAATSARSDTRPSAGASFRIPPRCPPTTCARSS